MKQLKLCVYIVCVCVLIHVFLSADGPGEQSSERALWWNLR